MGARAHRRARKHRQLQQREGKHGWGPGLATLSDLSRKIILPAITDQIYGGVRPGVAPFWAATATTSADTHTYMIPGSRGLGRVWPTIDDIVADQPANQQDRARSTVRRMAEWGSVRADTVSPDGPFIHPEDAPLLDFLITADARFKKISGRRMTRTEAETLAGSFRPTRPDRPGHPHPDRPLPTVG